MQGPEEILPASSVHHTDCEKSEYTGAEIKKGVLWHNTLLCEKQKSKGLEKFGNHSTRQEYPRKMAAQSGGRVGFGGKGGGEGQEWKFQDSPVNNALR
ncbi:hypothetical protein GDO81_005152 [Engystomops pustulosus]|uniref:Uncharacterized protein n=1 Tax=Engystomops pustulosus TaxID=76066 RepID=A0AAV7CLA9_ENGPU|nr:hypothetical protein GDO81_005152 [Engystomops pustulosus]